MILIYKYSFQVFVFTEAAPPADIDKLVSFTKCAIDAIRNMLKGTDLEKDLNNLLHEKDPAILAKLKDCQKMPDASGLDSWK